MNGVDWGERQEEMECFADEDSVEALSNYVAWN
jgi:hypothetical protein